VVHQASPMTAALISKINSHNRLRSSVSSLLPDAPLRAPNGCVAHGREGEAGPVKGWA
jgi:hypothetical protein